MKDMSTTAHIIVVRLVFFTMLASIAEIVLASLVLHYLNSLNDEFNYAYNGMEESSADPTLPFPATEQHLQYEQPWVLVHKGLVSAIPRIELATGTITLALGILISAYVLEKAWASRRSDLKHVVSRFGANDRIAAILLPGMALVITVLFIYAFAVSSYSANQSHLLISGPLGGESYDATPIWEVWTCAMSSFLNKHQDFPAARSEWNTVCRITTGARWTLVPVFVLAILPASTTLIFQYRSALQN